MSTWLRMRGRWPAEMEQAAPAITMLAAFALALFGAKLLRTPDRTKGALMLVMAAVLVANVLIWTM